MKNDEIVDSCDDCTHNDAGECRNILAIRFQKDVSGKDSCNLKEK